MSDRVKSEKTMRVSFTVPPFDTQVSEWAKNQRNISLSLRLLIKSHIAKYGMIDVTALPMTIDETSQVFSANIEPAKSMQTISAETKISVPDEQETVNTVVIPEPIAVHEAAAPASRFEQAEPEIVQPAAQPKVNSMLADLMK